MHRITLVGYRGSGKSTVGRALAQALGWDFHDCDTVVEERAGRSIREIFRIDGEEAFRDLEEHCLNGLLSTPEPLVLATGGGCILRPSNRELLRAQGGLVVYLRAEPAVLQARLAADLADRPALSGSDPVAEVPEHLARRQEHYAAVADLTVDASRPVSELVALINATVEKSRRKPDEKSA